jgi:hypothetical protein
LRSLHKVLHTNGSPSALVLSTIRLLRVPATYIDPSLCVAPRLHVA